MKYFEDYNLSPTLRLAKMERFEIGSRDKASKLNRTNKSGIINILLSTYLFGCVHCGATKKQIECLDP